MAKGISTQGDVLVNVTADGVDLNEIWAEIHDVLELYNRERSGGRAAAPVTRRRSWPTLCRRASVRTALRKPPNLVCRVRFGPRATC